MFRSGKCRTEIGILMFTGMLRKMHYRNHLFLSNYEMNKIKSFFKTLQIVVCFLFRDMPIKYGFAEGSILLNSVKVQVF